MRLPNPFNIGRCNWAAGYQIAGCRKPKGHADRHELRSGSMVPVDLGTREEQEAWAKQHALAWELGPDDLRDRLDERR